MLIPFAMIYPIRTALVRRAYCKGYQPQHPLASRPWLAPSREAGSHRTLTLRDQPRQTLYLVLDHRCLLFADSRRSVDKPKKAVMVSLLNPLLGESYHNTTPQDSNFG